MKELRVIDSHTGGEPTRVILEDGIRLAGDTMAERRADFLANYDWLRRGAVTEPRGSDVIVGAVLTPPVTPAAVCGVVYFNNVGGLGMCGHGTIGVVETLRWLGRVQPGEVVLDTPVGSVAASLLESGEVALKNVPARRFRADVAVDVPGAGSFTGDVAYGGNWFYIVHEPEFEICLARARELSDLTLKIMDALRDQGITGEDGAVIDHVELGGKAAQGADSRNFVMCPGGAYDRSPCGTGTSAKLACLFEAGLLAEGQAYVQESVTGSRFRGSVTREGGLLIPAIAGRAHVTADVKLIFDSEDPLRWGIQ